MKVCIYTNGHNISNIFDGMDYTITYVDVSRFSSNMGTYYEVDINEVNSATLFTLKYSNNAVTLFTLKYSNNAVAMYDTFTVYRFT
jgi:hypothetical protein